MQLQNHAKYMCGVILSERLLNNSWRPTEKRKKASQIEKNKTYSDKVNLSTN